MSLPLWTGLGRQLRDAAPHRHRHRVLVTHQTTEQTRHRTGDGAGRGSRDGRGAEQETRKDPSRKHFRKKTSEEENERRESTATAAQKNQEEKKAITKKSRHSSYMTQLHGYILTARSLPFPPLRLSRPANHRLVRMPRASNMGPHSQSPDVAVEMVGGQAPRFKMSHRFFPPQQQPTLGSVALPGFSDGTSATPTRRPFRPAR